MEWNLICKIKMGHNEVAERVPTVAYKRRKEFSAAPMQREKRHYGNKQVRQSKVDTAHY
jgi:hypothetical protein